jgi:Flp pilus assembly protein TadG
MVTLNGKLKALGQDESGVSAVEFALLAPALVGLALGAGMLAARFMEKQSIDTLTYSAGQVLVTARHGKDVDVAKLVFSEIAPKIIGQDLSRLRGSIVQVRNKGGALVEDWRTNAPFGAAADLPELDASALDEGKSALLVSFAMAQDAQTPATPWDVDSHAVHFQYEKVANSN